MGNERPQADHLGAEGFDEPDIGHQVVEGLERAAHHHARTGLKTQRPQFVQAGNPVFELHGSRVQAGIVAGVGAFVAQQVAVRAAAAQQRVAFLRQFTQRECDGRFGPGCTHLGHGFGQGPYGGRILSALQHESPQAQFPGAVAAGKDVFVGEGVARQPGVAAPDAAVQTVVAADVAPFDQGAQPDGPAEAVFRHFPGVAVQLRGHGRVVAFQQRLQSLVIQRFPLP